MAIEDDLRFTQWKEALERLIRAKQRLREAGRQDQRSHRA
jgi:hypothetical protein